MLETSSSDELGLSVFSAKCNAIWETLGCLKVKNSSVSIAKKQRLEKATIAILTPGDHHCRAAAVFNEHVSAATK